MVRGKSRSSIPFRSPVSDDERRPLASRQNDAGTSDEECWWIDVLHDPRARWPQQMWLDNERHARFRIDRCPTAEMVLTCARCRLRRNYKTADMIQSFGRGFNTVLLRHRLSGCPKGGRDAVYEPCVARFEHWDIEE
jgi:hypothetical protein